MPAVNPLEYLVSWYRAQCNGSWEQANGVTIETMNTPGWMVTIDLIDTPLENKTMRTIRQERSPTDWLLCEVDHGHFRGQGDLQKLIQILHAFQIWVTDMSRAE